MQMRNRAGSDSFPLVLFGDVEILSERGDGRPTDEQYWLNELFAEILDVVPRVGGKARVLAFSSPVYTRGQQPVVVMPMACYDLRGAVLSPPSFVGGLCIGGS